MTFPSASVCNCGRKNAVSFKLVRGVISGFLGCKGAESKSSLFRKLSYLFITYLLAGFLLLAAFSIFAAAAVGASIAADIC
jgi:hypothetical protein